MKKQRHYFVNKGPSSQGCGFSSGHVWMWELDYKESLALKKWCFWTVMLEKTLESPLDCKEIQPVHSKGDQSWKDWCWSWNSNTLVTWCKELTHWKRSWCWERLRAGGKGDNRGQDVWVASPTQWTWVWVDSGSWWWTGRPGVLRFVGSQKVGHDWVTELNFFKMTVIISLYPDKSYEIWVNKILTTKFTSKKIWSPLHGQFRSLGLLLPSFNGTDDIC